MTKEPTSPEVEVISTEPLLDEGSKSHSFTLFRAKAVLFWEAVFPALLPAFGVIYLLVVLSLFGFWQSVPTWIHWLALLSSLVGVAFLLRRDLPRNSLPTKHAAKKRLEQDGAVTHGSLRALDDAPFDQAQSNPLWRAHQRQNIERAKKARLGRMRDTVTARDPYGARFIATGLFAIALIAAGDDWRQRVFASFKPNETARGSLLADIWIEPPAYTGNPPIYVLRGGEKRENFPTQLNAPAGSVLMIQTNGGARAKLTYRTDVDQYRAEFNRNGSAARAELALTESGIASLSFGGKKTHWPIGVLRDMPPGVAFTEKPTATDQALVAFRFRALDDYGIAKTWFEYRLDPDQDRALDAPVFSDAVLDEKRIFSLEHATGNFGEQSVALDLQNDPWAGLSVFVRVAVEDGAGQVAKSDEVILTLPTRTFFNPLAKSVLEQRQTLAVAPKSWPRTGRSFDALTMAPEAFFGDEMSEYLMLRAAFWRVMRQDGENFDDAIKKFWPLALQLEDKAVEIARQRLEAAQESLREAIERGASDDEISRLTEELRQAMNDYLAAMAQAGQISESTSSGGETLESGDLNEMLDGIRDMAQRGAGAAARQLLSDFENLMNNLRLSQSGQGGGQSSSQGADGQPGSEQGGAGQAGDLIGRQRELADEAYRRGQSFGETGDDLAEEQRALGRALDELRSQSNGGGGDSDNEALTRDQAFAEARENMRDAAEALGNDDFDGAASAMERAVENLRRGGDAMARDEMRQAAEEAARGEQGSGLDPLGRPAGEARGTGVEVPALSEAGRSRAVIDELRKRLGEPNRSEEEIEYLERLLERF